MGKIVSWIDKHFVLIVSATTLVVLGLVLLSNATHDHSKCNHEHGTHHAK